MSQATDFGMMTSGPTTAVQLAARLNPSFNALLSCHSGTSRPSYAVAGTVWLDTTGITVDAVTGIYVLNIYDGADDIPLIYVDPTNDRMWSVESVPEITIASAATTDVLGAISPRVYVTGNSGPITSLGDTPNKMVWVRFEDDITLTNSATLKCPGDKDLDVLAGSNVLWASDSDGVPSYIGGFRSDGTPLIQPEAPSLGGSYRNLTVKVTSATAGTITAEAILLENSSGQVKRFSSVDEAFDITTSGAGGLDAGTEAVSTWYAVHLIGKEDGTLDALLSTSATAPTLPTGYTYSARVGWVRNDSSGDLIRQIKRNDLVQYIVGTNPSSPLTILSGVVAAGTSIDLSSLVPSSAIDVDVAATGSSTSGGATTSLGPNAATAVNSQSLAGLYHYQDANFNNGPARGRLVLETAQTIYGYGSLAVSLATLFGYRDTI